MYSCESEQFLERQINDKYFKERKTKYWTDLRLIQNTDGLLSANPILHSPVLNLLVRHAYRCTIDWPQQKGMRKHRQTKDCDDVVHHATVGQKWGGEVKEKRNWILRSIN
jgi:hypothetical protein